MSTTVLKWLTVIVMAILAGFGQALGSAHAPWWGLFLFNGFVGMVLWYLLTWIETNARLDEIQSLARDIFRMTSLTRRFPYETPDEEDDLSAVRGESDHRPDDSGDGQQNLALSVVQDAGQDSTPA